MNKDTNAAHDAADLGGIAVNYWKSVRDVKRPHDATVGKIFEAIRSGTYRDKVEAIRALPTQDERKVAKVATLGAWTFSGTFTYRNEQSMTTHSGFAVVDFDHMEPPVWTSTRERLTQDPFVYALFTSPSGDGLKVLVRIPPDKEAHRAHYRALLQHFRTANPDASNSDPARCCFVSWDPDLYVNESAEVFTDKDEQDAPPNDATIDADRAANIAAASPILGRILEQVEPVDFRALAGLVEGDKLRGQHYIVHTVGQVMEIARGCGWPLCRNAIFTYAYTGTHWQVLEPESIEQLLGLAAEGMGVDLNDARYFAFREKLLKQFLSAAHMNTPPPRQGVTLVNCLNGTFEVTIEGQQLRPFDPADFLRYCLPFNFDPAATAPEFMKYLNRVLPDPASQAIVAEFLGYCFTRGVKHEKVLILHGSGANGKSVLFDIVTAMLGGSANVTSFSLGDLTGDRGEYYRARIANKLLNYSSEINARNLNTEIAKQLFSNEPVPVRDPYGKPTQASDYSKFMFNANELPRDIEATHAFHRRLLIVPFEVRIPDAEQDKFLAQRIVATELSGVFNWCLEGLRRLLANGRFTHSDKVEQVAAEYRRLSDSVRAWIDETGLTPSATDYLWLKDLFTQYRNACLEGGNRPCSVGTFSERLKGAGFTIDKRNTGRIVWATRSTPPTDEPEGNVF